MSKDQRVYLRDILERIDRIEAITADGNMVFRQSHLHQDSLIRNFEVIGEIVKRLDPALMAQKPEIRWSAYAGFRDVLIHQYDKVILDIVWETAQTNLSDLRAAVEALLAAIPPDNS